MTHAEDVDELSTRYIIEHNLVTANQTGSKFLSALGSVFGYLDAFVSEHQQ